MATNNVGPSVMEGRINKRKLAARTIISKYSMQNQNQNQKEAALLLDFAFEKYFMKHDYITTNFRCISHYEIGLEYPEAEVFGLSRTAQDNA